MLPSPTPKCWSSDAVVVAGVDMDDFVGKQIEEGLDLSFQVGMSKIHSNANWQVGFFVHSCEFFRRIHQKPVFCRQILQSNVYAIFLCYLVEFLDALAHLFEVSAWIELADACALPRVKDPEFSVHCAGVGEDCLRRFIEAFSMGLTGEAMLMSAKGACKLSILRL